MEAVLKFGPPFLIENPLIAGLFLLSPALFAALGAFLLQGSYLRIVGGAAGGALRDILLLIAVVNGLVTPTNPFWTPDFSIILAFFGACGGALGSTLAPYRGKLLLLNLAIGGFAGQFLLPYLLGTQAAAPALSEEELLEKLNQPL